MSWGCDVSVLQLQFYHSHLIPKLIFLFIQITDVHIVTVQLKEKSPTPPHKTIFFKFRVAMVILLIFIFCFFLNRYAAR